MTQVIGHRGAPTVAPENTVASFRAAAALGADGVELDVRRATPGELAICHDERLADGRPVLGLARADWPDDLCDLPAALDACAGLATVNVEVKNWPADGDFDEQFAIAEAVASALTERSDDEQSAFLVSCFHLPTLDRVHEVAPQLRTAWLTIGFADRDADLARVAEHGHVAVHPHHGAVDEALVGKARAAGLAVNTWTCDLPDRMRFLAEVGVDGIVTNEVELALATLGPARGAR